MKSTFTQNFTEVHERNTQRGNQWCAENQVAQVSRVLSGNFLFFSFLFSFLLLWANVCIKKKSAGYCFAPPVMLFFFYFLSYFNWQYPWKKMLKKAKHCKNKNLKNIKIKYKRGTESKIWISIWPFYTWLDPLSKW